eukprot:2224405-Amphidinium_carterae.1
MSLGYDPQQNGCAERCVGIAKSLMRRLLVASSLEQEFGSYALRYSLTCLLAQAIGDMTMQLPPFASLVAVRKLVIEKGSRSFHARGLPGTFLGCKAFGDGSSWVLLKDTDEVIWAGKAIPLPYAP